MALNHMLWEGRSLPTTSGTSVCTGLVSFEVIFTGYLSEGREKKGEWNFTGVTVKITGMLDSNGTTNTGVVNPVQIRLESLRI